MVNFFHFFFISDLNIVIKIVNMLNLNNQILSPIDAPGF